MLRFKSDIFKYKLFITSFGEGRKRCFFSKIENENVA